MAAPPRMASVRPGQKGEEVSYCRRGRGEVGGSERFLLPHVRSSTISKTVDVLFCEEKQYVYPASCTNF
jgi:hypothetical protein